MLITLGWALLGRMVAAGDRRSIIYMPSWDPAASQILNESFGLQDFLEENMANGGAISFFLPPNIEMLREYVSYPEQRQ